MHGKRKPLARLAALLLSGCLLLALSGCRTGDGGESSVDDRVPDENGVFATGYPIVKEPITLKVLTYDLNNGFKPEDTALMQELEKKTNIHLEWTVTTGYAAANLQAAYASGDLPDILTGFYCDIAYQWPYIEQGMILQLDDWIPRYAPNVQAMFKQVPYAQYMSTALDGNIYSLPNVTVGSANSSFMGMLINQKWLDTLGLSMPRTTTQLTEVLRAFKKGDPNGNGQADEIPMLLHTDLPQEMYGWFGVSYNSEFPMYLTADGSAAYAPLSDGYKSTLKYAAALANEGLLDTTFIGTDDLTGYAAVLNASVETVGVIGGWNVNLNTMDATRQLEDYTYLPPLSADGASFVDGRSAYGGVWADKTLISAKCQNPAAALRLLDFFYSDEGAMWLSWGPPGGERAWHEDENGKYVQTLNNCPADKTLSAWKNSLTVGECLPAYFSKTLDEKIVEDSSTVVYQVKQRDIVQRKAELEEYTSAQVPSLRYDEDTLLFIQAQGRVIRDPMENYRRAVVKGEKNLDATWQAYTAETNTNGAKKYAAFVTDAYALFREWIGNHPAGS